jgi:hypothetical protein
MTRFTVSLSAALLALAMVAPDAHGQRLGVEVRAANAVATQKLAGADLSTGIGFGGLLAYRVNEHVAPYGGWDWFQFHAVESSLGSDLDFEETGYSLGLRFENAFGLGSRFHYRVEAGGTYKHVEVEDDGGDRIADSGHEPGFELGGGLLILLGESWRISPTFRYRSLQPVFDVDGVTTEGTLRYAALEFGASYWF